VPYIGEDGSRLRVPLRELFFNPSSFTAANFTRILRGLVSTRGLPIDASVVDALRNFLFRQLVPAGLDLVSLNIQRGKGGKREMTLHLFSNSIRSS
jgi:hypothetical protein